LEEITTEKNLEEVIEEEVIVVVEDNRTAVRRVGVVELWDTWRESATPRGEESRLEENIVDVGLDVDVDMDQTMETEIPKPCRTQLRRTQLQFLNPR
jgi:hypothetical protein